MPPSTWRRRAPLACAVAFAAIAALSARADQFATVVSFSGTDGANPLGALFDVGGTLYGTTENGGSANDGTVFSLNPTTGALATVASFTGTNAAGPYPASLMSAARSMAPQGTAGAPITARCFRSIPRPRGSRRSRASPAATATVPIPA